MGERKQIAFAMSAEDLAFPTSAMEFLRGGIEDRQEARRGYWEVQFDQALADHFPELQKDVEDD